MSDEVKDFQENMAKEVELSAKKKRLEEKEFQLRDCKADQELSRMADSKKARKLAESANFGAMSVEEISRLQQQNSDYFNAAKTGMVFVNESFNGIVPYFRKNLIVIGAKTGEGKSTASANIAFSTIQQVNPQTEKPRRALVITNEERTEDVYNRVICLIKGWHYSGHGQFTSQQIETFNDLMPELAKNGRLTVVDDSYGGTTGLTTTIEGIVSIFENLMSKQEFYDVIIIDYYQNVKASMDNRKMDEFDVQAMLSAKLDQFKNQYPAPIVIMAQVNPLDKEKKPFEFRIKGRKTILQVSTVALEMIADRENLRTEWVIHKSRYSDACGMSFFTGYDRGQFVPYSEQFIEMAKKRKIGSKDGNVITADFSKKS